MTQEIGVELIQKPQRALDILYLAARNCYSAKSPIAQWSNINLVDESKKIDLVDKVLKSGHTSLMENISYTFAIEGITRTCLAQLTRHRTGVVFAVQSQRYVEIKEDISAIEGRAHSQDNYLDDKEVLDLLDKYFVWDHNNYAQFHSLINALYSYLYQIKDGIKPEDARQVLPNCTRTNVVMTINARELMHICNLRLCTRAQLEIRILIKKVRNLVIKEERWLSNYLVANCEKNGFCSEGRSCGRRPKLTEIMKVWEDGNKSN